MHPRKPLSPLGMRLQIAMSLAGIRHFSDLAKGIDVRPQTINKWLHRERVNIDSDHLLAAAKLLHVDPYWLFYGTGDISPPRPLSPVHARILQRFDSLSPAAQTTLLAQLACDSIS